MSWVRSVLGPKCLDTTKATEFGKIMQNNAHYAIQGHRFWYQSKSHMGLPMGELPKLCEKISILMQANVLIADWSVAHFVVILLF